VIDSAHIGTLQVHGGGSVIGLDSFTLGSPEPRPVADRRPEEHGTVDETRWYGPRIIGMTGRIVAPTMAELWAALDDLKGAVALGQTVTLRFTRQGLEFTERAVVRVAGGVDVPLSATMPSPMVRFGITLEAPDPRLYSDTLSTGSYDPTDAGTGGLFFPLDFPLDFGADDSAGRLEVTNEGTFSTPAVLTITGPVTNPILDNDTAGLSIYTRDCALSAGETLVLDTLERSVMLGGTTSRPDLLDVELTYWWQLLPGVNQLRLRGSDMSAGQTALEVEYRDARI